MSVTGLGGTELRAEGLGRTGRRMRGFLGRILGRSDGLVGVGILAVFTIMAIAPTLFVGPLETVITSSGSPLESPSGQQPFGTDELGRSLLNLTVHGARISLLIGLLATVITIVLGVFVGVLAGYAGGVIDTLLMRVSDFFLVLPTIVLALILAPIMLEIIGSQAQIFGIRSTLVVVVVVIGLTSWATTARVIRSQVLSLKERMFVDRARVIGASSLQIMRRHILPNVVNLIVAQSVLTFATAVFTETTLAFIGLGDPTAPSWGQLLNNAQGSGAPGLGAWWYIVPPAVGVVMVVLSFTLVGNALDDVLNPKSGGRR